MINEMLNTFCRQLFAGSFETEDAKRPDLVFLRVRVLHLRCRTYFAAKCAFHDSFERGFAANRKGLGRHQKIVWQVKRGLHMGDDMVLWLTVNFEGCSHGTDWGLAPSIKAGPQPYGLIA